MSAERLQKCANSNNLAQGSSHLGVKPFGWFLPTEPQMTFAMAEQLDHEDKRTRLERCNALLRAVAHSRPIGSLDTNSSEPRSFTAITEISAERSTEAGKFIDLLVAGTSEGKQFECVIEAKLGHVITPGQLQSYTADNRGCDAENRMLVVVGPKLRSADARMIVEASQSLPPSKPWRFMDLRSFLIRYSSALQPNFDDEEFRRLRRTLHDSAESWL